MTSAPAAIPNHSPPPPPPPPPVPEPESAPWWIPNIGFRTFTVTVGGILVGAAIVALFCADLDRPTPYWVTVLQSSAAITQAAYVFYMLIAHLPPPWVRQRTDDPFSFISDVFNLSAGVIAYRALVNIISHSEHRPSWATVFVVLGGIVYMWLFIVAHARVWRMNWVHSIERVLSFVPCMNNPNEARELILPISAVTPPSQPSAVASQQPTAIAKPTAPPAQSGSSDPSPPYPEDDEYPGTEDVNQPLLSAV